MKQEINYPFTIQFLIERYEVRRQSLLEYTKNHISELNEDGVHARKFGKEWRFDEVAVSRLDELRGYLGASVAIYDYENPETVRANEAEANLARALEKIAELEQSNKRKDDALQSQAKALELQATKLEEADKKLKKAQADALLLTAAEADLKIAEADKCRQQKQISEQAEEIACLKAEFEAERKARQDAEARAEAEAKKTWWDKFWGK